MRDPRGRLRDILEAIVAIQRYGERSGAAFEHDELLQNWFVLHLEIIGEAARSLPGFPVSAEGQWWVAAVEERHAVVPRLLLQTRLCWADWP